MDDAALELQKLDALLAKGKWYFILVFGVFFWGMLTSLVVALIHYFISGDPILGGTAKSALYLSHWRYFIWLVCVGADSS